MRLDIPKLKLRVTKHAWSIIDAKGNTLANEQIRHGHSSADLGKILDSEGYELTTPEQSSSPDGVIKVLIATQPHRDDFREEFVTAILDRLHWIYEETPVVIKPHPKEQPEFYDQFSEQYEFEVRTGDIAEQTKWADMTFVMNSNVGLESVADGTPIACINLWEPFINSRPYQQAAAIPLLTEQAELDSFMEALRQHTVTVLRRRQLRWFDEEYGGEDVAENIAELVLGYTPSAGEDDMKSAPWRD